MSRGKDRTEALEGSSQLPAHPVLPIQKLCSHPFLVLYVFFFPRKNLVLRLLPFIQLYCVFSPKLCTAGGRCGVPSKPTMKEGQGF